VNHSDTPIVKVLSDIDGTLLRFGVPKVNPAVKDALKKLRRNNIDVHLATSRTVATTQGLVEDIAIGHQLAITDSGATVVYADTLEVVWKQWLDKELAYQLSSLLVPYATLICCTVKYAPFTKKDAKEMIAEGKHVFDDVPSIFMVHTQKTIQPIRTILASFKTIRTHTELFESGPFYGTQITRKGVDKKSGTMQLLALAGEYSGKILAIGDGSNDLPLFEAADIKVAMGSAPRAMKEQADFVTDTVDHDGFVRAMCEYNLI
jgi:Cof subfamily protein (haloacid dehalogenase superfamily)